MTQGKTFSYIRVSTSEQAETGNSLTMQEERIDAYCLSKGLPKPTVFADKGISATNSKNRPALQRMLNEAKKGDHIIFYAFDRFARNTRQALEMIETLTKKGITFHSLTQQIDTTTPMGQFAITIMAACAELESKTTGMRIKDNLQNRKSKKQSYTRHLTGFDNQNGILVPNEHLSTVNIILALKKQGKTDYAIAKELNEQGKKTIHNSAFKPISVTRIANNRVYSTV